MVIQIALHKTEYASRQATKATYGTIKRHLNMIESVGEAIKKAHSAH